MSLGMAEQDGVAVMLGAGVGVLSLAIVAASVMSGGALRAKAARWLRAVARKLTFAAVGAFLERKGYERLARIVTLQWSDLLLLWNPERRASARAARSGTTGARRAQQAKRTTPTVTLRSEGGSRAA